MAQNKTQPTAADVEAFLSAITPPARQADARAVSEIMHRVSGWPPTLWGPNIVGFGTYHYRYDSGREGDSLRVGFSPRKAALTLDIGGGFARHEELMARLGPHTTGKGCLYLKRLSDVDLSVLEELVAESLAYMRTAYPE
ncbi:MAG: DUF1801 domain-containing protein [Phenylobacterium sp.]|uniref:DUF1801 domain-containing protein n=1 Tax=Phenylobacterium sp. TaxID=1871053 RepID=UPI00273616F2|nr:DUF1801 domain-containing protein [Phenylobacterium sp.]MDP3748020.1 DUF1801 domain-containing protein [Phenylobacterium sp.]